MRHNWLGALLPLTLGACAAQIHTSSRVTYVAPRPVKLDTLAILPVTSGEGLEGFRRMISDSLFVSLTKARRDLVVLPAESTLSRLNAAGLNEKYAQAIRDYQQTSVLDRATVDTMSRVLHARFLLYIRAAYSQSKTVSGGILTGYNTSRDQDLDLVVHIWDGRQGDVVWEAVSASKVEAGELETSRRIDEILSSSVGDLVLRFP